MRRAAGWVVGATLIVGGCGDGPPSAPPAARETLPEGVVARVGDEPIASETVGRIAALKGLDRRGALDAAIQDAVFAEGARAELPATLIASAERRALAQALMRSMWLESKTRPITDEELDEATEVRWTFYDRPRGYRTVHVVVQLDQDAPQQEVRRAEKHAERLKDALTPLADQARRRPAPELDEESMFRATAVHADEMVAEWTKRVDAIDHGDLDVLAQGLPPITTEGRQISHDLPLNPNLFDEEFTRQAAALTDRGDLTPVFRSYAGFHVAMLLEVTPPRRLDRSARLDVLHDEILRVRALRERRALLEQLRARTPVDLPMNVDALLSRVRIELDEG